LNIPLPVRPWFSLNRSRYAGELQGRWIHDSLKVLMEFGTQGAGSQHPWTQRIPDHW
jgi:hypothetical protein